MAIHNICLVALLLLGVGADVAAKAPETAAQAGDASELLQNEEAGEEAETISVEESSQEEENDEEGDDDDEGDGEDGEDGENASLLQGAADAAGEDAEEEVTAQEDNAEDTEDEDDKDDLEEDDKEDEEGDDDDEGEGEDGQDASLLQGSADAVGEDAEEEVVAQEGESEDADDEHDEEEEAKDDANDAEPTTEALMAQLDENKDGKLSLEELTKGQSEEAQITHTKEAIKKVDSDADALVNMEELPKLTAVMDAEENEALMAQHDTNKDGKLSLEELTQGESDEDEVNHIKDALKKVDADADGFVNMDELHKYVAQMTE